MLVRDDDGHVRLEGPRIAGADTSAYWRQVLTGPGASRYDAGNRTAWSAAPGRQRAGAFILDAALPGDYSGDRNKLVCVGRKHRLYERTVSGLAATFERASAAGTSHVGMRDVHP